MLEDIRSISAAMPEPGTDMAGDAATVSRDMERIFGRVARRPAQTAARAADPVSSIFTGRPDSWRNWFLGVALVTLGALLVAGMAWMALRPQPKIVAVAPAARPPAPRPAVAPAPAPAPAMIVPVAPQEPAATAPPKSNSVARRAVQATGSARCSRLGGSARARCMRPHVLAADRQLRTAYARAVRAGVGSKTLSVYRKRWAQMRGKANANPVTVTAAYRQMARQLDATRRRR